VIQQKAYSSEEMASTSARNLTPQLHFKRFDTDLSSVRKNGNPVDVVGSMDVKDDDFEQY
jgi:hypothetical protein